MGFEFGAGKALRLDNWKLVKFRNGPWELYNLTSDRSETDNLAGKMPEKVKEMEKLFLQWQQRCKK